MTDREVMQMALEALELEATRTPIPETAAAIEALRARLAEPEPEPVAVAWMLVLPDGRLERMSVTSFDDEAEEMLARSIAGCTMAPLYTAPPTRRPLTDEEIWDIAGNCLDSVAGRLQFARAIERKITGGNDD